MLISHDIYPISKKQVDELKKLDMQLLLWTLKI